MGFEGGNITGESENNIDLDTNGEEIALNTDFFKGGDHELFNGILNKGVNLEINGNTKGVSSTTEFKSGNMTVTEIESGKESRKNVSIDMRDTQIEVGDKTYSGYTLDLGSRTTSSGIEETSVSLIWTQNMPEKAKIEAGIGYITGENNDGSYSQPYGKFNITKVVGDVAYSAGGYALGVGDIGELSDGAVIIFGSEDQPLVLHENKINNKTLVGLSFGVKKHIEKANTDMKIGCDYMRKISEEFSECSIKFDKYKRNGDTLFSAEILANEENVTMKLRKNLNQFLEDSNLFPEFNIVGTIDDSLHPRISLEFKFLGNDTGVRSFTRDNAR